MIGGAGQGLGDFTRGAAFVLSRPRLYKWIALPFVLSLVILVAIGWGAWAIAAPGAAAVAAWLPGFLAGLIGGALQALLVGLLAVGAYVLFVAVAALITTPFCEMLSEAIEEERTGVPGPPFSIVAFVRDVVLGLAHALRRVILYLLLVASIYLVGLVIPGVGPIVATVLSALVTIRFAAFDALDTVMARKGWRYAQKKAFVRAHSGRSFGLGAATAMVLVIPIVNVLAFPFAAAGATLMCLEVGLD